MCDICQVEQKIIRDLRHLPIAIVITRPEETRTQAWIWQCVEGQGTAATFEDALYCALNYLIGRIASPEFAQVIMACQPYSHGEHVQRRQAQ